MAVFDNKVRLAKDSENLVRVQELSLMMLKDFIKFCDENDINYVVAYGTTLGAIRHEGFIPWDDDIDLMMLRKDYNKFLKIKDKFNSKKYEVFTMENTDNLYKLFAKISLNGTRTYDFWHNNTDFTMGLSIDIFILDDIPKNNFQKKIFLKRRAFHRKLADILEVTNSDMYISKNKEKIGRILKKFLDLFHINQNFLINQNKRLRKEKKDATEVCDLAYDFVFPKNIFENPIKKKFEDIEVKIPSDWDNYLRIVFGDYMELPPENERIVHVHEIDFGPYEKSLNSMQSKL